VVRAFDAVIFDMDGVLADSEPMHREITRAMLAAYGVAHPDEVEEELVGFRDLDMFRVLCERHRLPDDAETLTERRTALTVARITQGVPALPGIPDVPARLAAEGYRLAVASSSCPEIIEATLAVLGIAPLFPVTVSAVGLARGKPAPDVFLEAARRLSVTPTRCLVIEDSRHGVLAAKAAGMRCAAIPCGLTLNLDLTPADWRLNSLLELVRVLEPEET